MQRGIGLVDANSRAWAPLPWHVLPTFPLPKSSRSFKSQPNSLSFLEPVLITPILRHVILSQLLKHMWTLLNYSLIPNSAGPHSIALTRLAGGDPVLKTFCSPDLSRGPSPGWPPSTMHHLINYREAHSAGLARLLQHK